MKITNNVTKLPPKDMNESSKKTESEEKKSHPEIDLALISDLLNRNKLCSQPKSIRRKNQQSNHNSVSDISFDDLQNFFDFDNNDLLELLVKELFTEFNLVHSGSLTRLVRSAYPQEKSSAILDFLGSISPDFRACGQKSEYVDNATFSYIQVLLYKVLPCPFGMGCSSRPRQIVESNQFKKWEFSCPFFHPHRTDQRRIPIFDEKKSSFNYKATYLDTERKPENGSGQLDPNKFAHNFFESLFHPAFYKVFKCKQIHCENNFMCPFVHNDVERPQWERIFKENTKISRESLFKNPKSKANNKQTDGTNKTKMESEARVDSMNLLKRRKSSSKYNKSHKSQSESNKTKSNNNSKSNEEKTSVENDGKLIKIYMLKNNNNVTDVNTNTSINTTTTASVSSGYKSTSISENNSYGSTNSTDNYGLSDDTTPNAENCDRFY